MLVIVIIANSSQPTIPSAPLAYTYFVSNSTGLTALNICNHFNLNPSLNRLQVGTSGRTIYADCFYPNNATMVQVVVEHN